MDTNKQQFVYHTPHRDRPSFYFEHVYILSTAEELPVTSCKLFLEDDRCFKASNRGGAIRALAVAQGVSSYLRVQYSVHYADSLPNNIDVSLAYGYSYEVFSRFS